jgi:hypothetical protein
LFITELEKFPYDREIDALLHPDQVREEESSDSLSGEDARIKSFMRVMISKLDYPEIVALCMTSRAANDFCRGEYRGQIVKKRVEMIEMMSNFSLRDWDLYCQDQSDKKIGKVQEFSNCQRYE